ncbi:MAG: hypothetical protein IPM39_06250 [Chloroflexi bacterium]|nr:hypothetical protein [Chloroflexota bacterium]
MKNKWIAVLFAICFIAAGLFVPQPAAAYTGANVIVRDSVTIQPWVWGGDVYLVNQTTGTIAGTGELNANGQVSIPHGTGTLCTGVGGCVSPLPGQVIELIIDFECQLSGNCSGGPNGTPQTFGELTYTQNALPLYISRDVRTGTGPLAVSLSGIGGGSSSPLPYAAAAAAVMLGAATIFVVRRRQA